MKKLPALLIGLCSAFSLAQANDPLAWKHHGRVAEGGQIDALCDAEGTVHLAAGRYHTFPLEAPVFLPVSGRLDERQNGMDMPPALALSPAGDAFVLGRQGGSWELGHDNTVHAYIDGEWKEPFTLSEPRRRNYVVGIAANEDGVFALSGHGLENVWGPLDIFQLRPGTGEVEELGQIHGIWRVDNDARMRGHGDRLWMVAGKNDLTGSATITWADTSKPDVVGQFRSNRQRHTAGEGRRGFPDLDIDAAGDVHLSYGDQSESVYYNRYDRLGNRVSTEDKLVLDGLGSWHLSVGLSAVAASDDGQKILIVALKSDGSKGADRSELLYAYSNDGGESFSRQKSLGVFTDGGEGRRRPRLVSHGDRFGLLFFDLDEPGIHLMTTSIE